MGTGAQIGSPPLKRGLHILISGSAFFFSALSAIAPAGGDPAGSRPSSPRYQFSSFADDTALYEGAYCSAWKLIPDGREDGRSRTGRIMAGTISHHLFIRDLIAQYFIELARCVNPRTIIVLGPNHHARGHSPIALSALRWRTPFGFVDPDTEVIRKLSHTGLACVEEGAFVNEHSIGALVPFIRKSFPGSMIVPVIFKKIADREDCARLAGVLPGLMDRTLVLASVDFSHYKTRTEAEREDMASLDVIRSLSEGRVDEAFVDSRPALLTLLKFCKNLGATNVEVVQHTNSGILSHKGRVPCTSYINTYIREQASPAERRNNEASQSDSNRSIAHRMH